MLENIESARFVLLKLKLITQNVLPNGSCVPRKCTIFHSVGGAYRIGFSQPIFTGKCPEKCVDLVRMVVVRWKEVFGVAKERCSFGMAGGMYPGKGVGKLWGWSAAFAPAEGSKHHFGC